MFQSSTGSCRANNFRITGTGAATGNSRHDEAQLTQN
jgi:hypothetical protein